MQTGKSKYLILACIVIISLSTSFRVTAQSNKPGAQSQAPAATAPIHQGADYQGNVKVNYVRVKEAMGAIGDANTFNSADYNDVRTTTQYTDGLGRPLQTVMRQITPGLKDLVTPVEYDALGREKYKYLPYAQTTGSSTNNGSFKLTPFTDQVSFYENSSLNPGLAGEQVFYGQTNFEASPLDRINKTLAAGNSWAGNDRGVDHEYLVNTDADAVRVWTISNDYPVLDFYNGITNNIPISSSSYAAGQLSKTVSRDESGNVVVEYKDKSGLVILKKVQIGAIPADYSGYVGFLSTYYIYDDFGQLRVVVPPNSVKSIQYTWTLDLGVLNSCFRYAYDERKRMIVKCIPGAHWIGMVYDKRDRLVYTQDGNLRNSHQWMTTLYDGLNRPVTTGIITYTGTMDALQAYVNQNTGSSISGSVQINQSAPDNLYVNQRVNGVSQYQAGFNITISPEFETEANAEIETTVGFGTTTGASNVAVIDNPLPPGNNLIPLTITYYDNYDWTNATYASNYNNLLTAGNNLHAVAMPGQAFMGNVGRVTGTKVRVFENYQDITRGGWLATVNFFDDRGRPIQTQTGNYKGGTDVTTNLFDFSGKVLSTYLAHNNPAAGAEGTMKLRTDMEYDHAGRLLKTWKTINDDNSKTVLIAANIYNELGQLATKELGRKKDGAGNYTQTPIESLDYTYNVRGWLQGINKDFANNTGPTANSKWFGMELDYDWGFTNNQYNGNIAGTKWRSRGDGEQRAYGFGYDAANRLMAADFNQLAGSSWQKSNANGTVSIDFSSYMGNGTDPTTAYDQNGNILKMKQWGLKGSTSTVIDDLTYYYRGANQLSLVSDAVTEDNKLGDFVGTHTYNPTETPLMLYDDNGNLTYNILKSNYAPIPATYPGQGIYYNYMNLPVRIFKSPSGVADFIYDATGAKLGKTVYRLELGPQVRPYTLVNPYFITYFGPFQYLNDKLQTIMHEEGRIRVVPATASSPQSFAFDYFVKDHLGSIRAVLTDEQQQDVYPAVTMEGAATGPVITTEQTYYSIDPNYQVDKPSGVIDYQNNNGNPPYNNNPASNTTAISQKMYKLRGTINKTGLGITLKVMAGDQINIFGKSYWTTSGGNFNQHTAVPVGDILDAFLGTPNMVGKGVTKAAIGTTALTDALQAFSGRNDEDGSKPWAYINWVFFDDQFNFVSGGFDRVAANGTLKVHDNSIPTISALKNGYVFVYCSNESDQDVLFDNLQVIHTRGPLLEETHYYPFGLTMAGISSKALKPGYAENKNLYNGKELQSREFSDGTGLEDYDYGARFFDPQIGVWHNVDPLADKSRKWSPYSFAFDNPMRFIDRDGMSADDFVKDKKGNIRWDNNATSQATTKKGETYLGKTLTFKFNSYIDGKRWDGPLGKVPAGDKLTSTVTVTGNSNDKGELTSITTTKSVELGQTPIGNARDFYPGLGNDQNKFNTTGTADGGFNVSMEQHGSVSSIEEVGLHALGYNIVNVAQKLDVNISQQGNVSVSAAVDVFPSATLSVNGSTIMQYNQPSFESNFKAPVVGNTTGGTVPGVLIRDFSNKPARWLKRL